MNNVHELPDKPIRSIKLAQQSAVPLQILQYRDGRIYARYGPELVEVTGADLDTLRQMLDHGA